MKRTLLLFLLGCTIFSQSCKKDELVSAPEVQTISVTAISPTKASFSGNIINMGKSKILDYGFVYGTQADINETKGTKISLGNDAKTGEFTVSKDNLQFDGYMGYQPTLYVRAYLRDEKGTAFGKLLTVQLPSASASNISPNVGKSGDQVKIIGNFYSPTLDQIKVYFSDVAAKVISATSTEILVEVPTGINARHGYQINVNVELNGVPLSMPGSFIIMANIKDFFPKTGPISSTVSFTGDNLPYDYYYNSISVVFDEVPASILYNGNFQVMVPASAKNKSKISVIIGGQRTTLPGEFTIVLPEIEKISPESGLPGSTIQITGTNFPSNYERYPSLKLGDNAYQDVYPEYNKTFNFYIPDNTAAGEYSLTMKFGNIEVQAPKKLKVLSYEAKSISPSKGAPGKEVNISGIFIKDAGYNIDFGTMNTYGTATSASNLRTVVPMGINAGKVKVAVNVPGKRIVIPGEFEILGPSLDSFYPLSGVAGTIITIKGSGFYANDYYNQVKFGTISVQPINVTENTITVAVPSNLNLGAMKLTVVTGGQSVISSTNFTATN